MANTTLLKGRTIQITGLDANWCIAVDMPGFLKSGLIVNSITFVSKTVGDHLIVREGATVALATAGPTIVDDTITSEYDTRRHEFKRQRMWPAIIIAQCTLGTAATSKVIIEIA